MDEGARRLGQTVVNVAQYGQRQMLVGGDVYCR